VLNIKEPSLEHLVENVKNVNLKLQDLQNQTFHGIGRIIMGNKREPKRTTKIQEWEKLQKQSICHLCKRPQERYSNGRKKPCMCLKGY